VSDHRPQEVAVADAGLRAYPECPLCGSIEREGAQAATRPNKYTRSIPRVLPFSTAEFSARVSAYRCRVCGTLYCDPWLSGGSSARVYGIGHGQHAAGWEAFSAHLDGKPARSFLGDRLWKAMLGVVPDVRGYAELNCPFIGLLPYFDSLERPAGSAARGYRAARESVLDAARYPASPLRSVRRLLRRRGSNAGAWPVPPRRPELPAERVLILEPSTLCWGPSCTRSGLTCWSTAASLLGTGITTRADIVREDRRFDVIHVRNLDHFFQAMELLEFFLERAQLVVIGGHNGSRLTIQHLFSLSPGLVRFMQSRGYQARDMTQSVLEEPDREREMLLFFSKSIALAAS
jgi:hypothetical protein